MLNKSASHATLPQNNAISADISSPRAVCGPFGAQLTIARRTGGRLTIARLIGVIAALALTLSGLILPGTAYGAPRKAAMVIDANTGKILYSASPDRLVYPASLTKMMTLFIMFDELERGRLKQNTRITISAKAARVQPSKLGLKAGSTITVANAIKALITKSANDIAIAVAEHIGRSESAFAKRMTRRARELGMARTVFKNASGLPDTDQVTTARDMLKLGLALIEVHARHYHLFSMRSFSYKGRRYGNHNGLLKNYPGTDGLKTGYTRASGFNLVASVRRSGKHVVGAVFGGKTGRRRNRLMRSLLTKAFKSASKTKLRKYQRQRRDLIARVTPRRTPRPRIAKRPTRLAQARPRRAQPRQAQPRQVRPRQVRPKLARRRQAQPQRRMRRADKRQPQQRRLQRQQPQQRPAPAIRISKVRPVRFAQLQRGLTAQPVTSSGRRIITDASRQVTTIRREPARLPRGGTNLRPATAAPSQFALIQQPTTARQPSTFQQQAATMAISNRLQYGAAPAFRTAMLRSTFAPSSLAPQPARRDTFDRVPAQSRRSRGRETANRASSRQQQRGTYQVQIGAYGTVTEAERRIKTVRANAGSLLDGFGTLTMAFNKANRRYYRARFSGFDSRSAADTCAQLRQRKVDCFVTRAQ